MISAAHRLFAERGFEGVSIAEIASELGISKQALLHHFGTKEKLYGKVLENLSARFETIIITKNASDLPPDGQLRAVLSEIYVHMNHNKHDARLIMRELLENQPRTTDKQRWYLRPFLEAVTEIIQRIPGLQSLSNAEAMARTFQLLGAINYFAIAEPTFRKMFGNEVYTEIDDVFLDQLSLTIIDPQSV